MIEHIFADNYLQIRRAVKRDVRMWGSFPSGPFNTDPLIEPRLKYLSKTPDYSVVDSSLEDGRLSLFLIFWCDGVIRCEQYQEHGPDEPLSTRTISSGVTYEIPVSVVMELQSGEIEEFEISDLAWEKWDNWPEQQDQ
jgi:hypothetical protein